MVMGIVDLLVAVAVIVRVALTITALVAATGFPLFPLSRVFSHFVSAAFAPQSVLLLRLGHKVQKGRQTWQRAPGWAGASLLRRRTSKPAPTMATKRMRPHSCFDVVMVVITEVMVAVAVVVVAIRQCHGGGYGFMNMVIVTAMVVVAIMSLFMVTLMVFVMIKSWPVPSCRGGGHDCYGVAVVAALVVMVGAVIGGHGRGGGDRSR